LKVCIAEKPSVAREIAQILGANSKRDGYFEGNGYRVTWTFGHLCTLKEPDEYTSEWKKWNLSTLPMLPEKFDIKLISNAGVGKQFKIIKSLFDECEEVINCGDAGIEGELIQRWVLRKAGCRKPVKRLWISSLTEEAIKEGFTKLKESRDYDLLYEAGNSRAIGDWLLGMNATRLYTLKYADGKGVLSIGRVQTPTLALIVKRHYEIENFKPEKYWELKTTYRDVLFSAIDGKFSSVEEADKIIEKIKDTDFTVTSFTRKKGNEAPPPLFDLTSLQVECNKRFGFSADNTLKIVQNLYEKKFVTYPRVDTRFLPSDIYPKVPGILKGLKRYQQETEPVLAAPIKKSKKVFDDAKVTDHHAIIPTGVNPQNLQPNDEKVFDTIARRFIAVFYPDCIVMNTTVLGEVEDVKFKATGKQILEEGWRALYPKQEKQEKKDDEDEPQIIPEFVQGESGPHTPQVFEKETKPPKPYTEATLLRAMETAGKWSDDDEIRDAMKENGIGRPSTRAGIIETLFKRSYIRREKKNIIATPTGIQLIDTIENDLLKSVELTGLWEGKLRRIEKGEFMAAQFLEEMKVMVAQLVSDVKQESGKKIQLAVKKAAGKSASSVKTYHDTSPQHDRSQQHDTSPQHNKSQQKGPAPTSTGPQQVRTRFNASDKSKASAEDKASTPPLCPVCKKGRIIKGKAAYGCSEYKAGCTFRVSFEISGKKLTEKQIFTLIEKGKTGEISGFTVNGKKVKGQIFLNGNSIPSLNISSDDPAPVTKELKTPAASSQNEPLRCRKCGQGVMIKGKAAWGCSRYREGCRFVIPFEQLQREFNTTELTGEMLERIQL
jgi:DNA topoisomerase-3